VTLATNRGIFSKNREILILKPGHFDFLKSGHFDFFKPGHFDFKTGTF
jgi:hypothetical protein